MTKLSKRTLIIFLIFILITSLLLAYFCLPYWVYKKPEKSHIEVNKDESLIKVNGNSIKVLQFTDLHINNAPDMPITFHVIKRTIYKTNPDLIVFTGDIFSSSATKKNVDTFLNFVSKFDLPWAVALGNHDDETPYTLNELSSKIESADLSLFKTGDLTDLDLYGNYYYDVEFSDNNKYQFIFMDSRSAGFKEESKTFYEETITNAKNNNGGNTVNNFLFFHIPLKEVNDAIEEFNNGNIEGVGRIRETPCIQSTDIHFFDKVKELNATTALIYGHDHINNLKLKYQGVYFNYGAKSSTSSYNNTKIGGTLYTLNSDGTFTFNDILIFNQKS